MAGFVTQSEYISLPICNDHRDTHLQPPTKHLSWGTVSVSLLCWQELNFWLVAVVQSLSHVRLFVISWTAVCQLSLVFAFSQSLLKFMSIESVMPSNPLSSVTPFSSCTQHIPAPGSFPMSLLFASSSQSIGASASATVLPMSIQGWFL